MKRSGALTCIALLLVSSAARAQDAEGWQEAPPLPPQVEEEQPPLPGAPAVAPTQQDFDDALSYYGHWVDVPDVGRTWVPWENAVGADFEPYATDGDWAYTSSGWEFESQFAFGWAVFHYGRWVSTTAYGWAWTPGYRWGPAWVEWRYKEGYVGWAPLGPRGHNVPFGPSATGWNFVHHSYLGHPGMNQNLVPYEARQQPGWWHAATSAQAGRGTYAAGRPATRASTPGRPATPSRPAATGSHTSGSASGSGSRGGRSH